MVIVVITVVSGICCAVISRIARRTGFLRRRLCRPGGSAGIDIFPLGIAVKAPDLQVIAGRRLQAL